MARHFAVGVMVVGLIPIQPPESDKASAYLCSLSVAPSWGTGEYSVASIIL